MTHREREPGIVWPQRLLALLLVVQVWLAIKQLVWRMGFPPRTNHFGFKNILELRRLLEGYTPTWALVHPGRTTHFYPEFTSVDWTSPVVMFQEMLGGRLRPLFQNHRDVFYWVEIPHPFFLATVWGAITDWAVWAIPLVFTGYLCLLLVSLYGIGRAVDGPWTGLAAACVASGFPMVFGFGRFIHDTLPIAALATFMVWMALSSEGFRRWGRCVAFGFAGWSMLRSGESFYGSVLGLLVILGPVLGEVLHALRSGLDRRGVVGLLLLVGIPIATFDWWWFPSSLQYLNEEAPFEDIAMAPVVAGWVDSRFHVAVQYGAYFLTLVSDLVRPLVGVWVVLGLLFIWRSPARRKVGIALMMLVPLAALSWMTRKSNWYVVPIAPGLALLAVMGLRGLPGRLSSLGLGAAAVAGVISLVGYGTANDELRRQIPAWADRPFRTTVNMREVELVPYRQFAGKAVVDAAQEVLTSLERNQPADGEQRMLALFCTDQFWAWTFKYYVEMARPDIHVVSIIHMNLLEHYAAELEAQQFSWLVHLGDHGLMAWDPEPSTGLPASLKRPQMEGMDHFGRFIRGLRQHTLVPIATHQAPIYQVSSG